MSTASVTDVPYYIIVVLITMKYNLKKKKKLVSVKYPSGTEQLCNTWGKK